MVYRNPGKATLKRTEHKTITYRSFKSFNEQAFLKDLSARLSTFEYSQNDSDDNFENWNTVFITILNDHAPIKTKRVKRDVKPEWMTNEIASAQRNRDRYHKKKDWENYKYWRNKTKTLIRKSKRDFFTNAINETKNNKFLWDHINDIQGKSKTLEVPSELIVDGTAYTDKQDVIDKLNAYFANISERLREGCSTARSEHDRLRTFVETKLPSGIQFNIPSLKLEQLTSILKSLDATKATGLDQLSPRLLKLSASVIAPSLLKIINISLHTASFPKILKSAKLIPIHKGGLKNEPSNYRPISILPVLSSLKGT